MKLQALLKKYSNQLTGLSALLILIAYSGKYLLNSYFLWAFALLLATFIGLVPIAFQAVQALKFFLFKSMRSQQLLLFFSHSELFWKRKL